MNSRFACWTIALLTVVSGCVPSLNPVYKDENLIFDATVLGIWAQPDSKARWDFAKRDEKSYRLIYTDDDGQEGRFIAHLASVEGTKFLDLFPEEVDTKSAGFYRFHLVPIHTIYLVKRTQPTLELTAIDYQWLDDYLTKNPDAVQCATFNGRKMITAPTEQVQAFVLAHQDRFTGKFDLERKTAEPK